MMCLKHVRVLTRQVGAIAFDDDKCLIELERHANDVISGGRVDSSGEGHFDVGISWEGDRELSGVFTRYDSDLREALISNVGWVVHDDAIVECKRINRKHDETKKIRDMKSSIYF